MTWLRRCCSAPGRSSCGAARRAAQTASTTCSPRTPASWRQALSAPLPVCFLPSPTVLHVKHACPDTLLQGTAHASSALPKRCQVPPRLPDPSNDCMRHAQSRAGMLHVGAGGHGRRDGRQPRRGGRLPARLRALCLPVAARRGQRVRRVHRRRAYAGGVRSCMRTPANHRTHAPASPLLYNSRCLHLISALTQGLVCATMMLWQP